MNHQQAYNLIVIGGGSGGLLAAAGAAGLGARVALVQAGPMGGDCLNYGCVPSKAFIRCGKQAHAARSGGYGVAAVKPQVSWKDVIAHVQASIAAIAPHDSVERFRSLGVDVFLGKAKLKSRSEVTVASDDGKLTLRARAILISTGGRPAVPPIPGLKEAGFLTNETIFSHPQQPRSILVLGGGAIGVELGQSLGRLGSEVHLVEAAPRLLPAEDEDITAIIQQVLQNEGVQLYTNNSVTAVAKQASQKSVQLQSSSGQSRQLMVDEILLAVGRKPNTEDLGLAELGIETQRGFISVNDRMQTNISNIFACGDVCGPYLFTHMAGQQARIVIQNALLPFKARMEYHAVPWCVFTEPEIASAGLSETRAKAENIPHRTFTIELKDIDRAVCDGIQHGMLKVVVDTSRRSTLLGASIVAPHAGEMLSQLTLVIQHKLSLHHVGSTIHPYPTLAEICRRAADLSRKASFTPLVARVFKTYLGWRR